MDPACQVKQYVAVVKSRETGCQFRVFETGDPKFYLFDLLDEYDCSTTIQFPVRKADLNPEIRRALRHGWGNSL